MTSAVAFDTSLCQAIGCEPGSDLCGELEQLAQIYDVSRGNNAPLDLERPLLVYVARGAVKLVGQASGAREQIVAFHLAGDILTIAADPLHDYRVNALSDSRLIVFDAQHFLDLAGGAPAIMRALIDRIQAALHRSRDKAVSLGRKSAQERVAGFLYSLSKRMKASENGKCVLDLPMSRRDIGDSLGLTIETVSRQFSELRTAGLIETCGRSRVLLPDIGALARRAGHSEGEGPTIAGS